MYNIFARTAHREIAKKRKRKKSEINYQYMMHVDIYNACKSVSLF